MFFFMAPGSSHRLDEAPAVPLEVERLVAAIARLMVAHRLGDLRTGGERALVVCLDVGDGHAEVLARDAGALGTDRAVGALGTDPDHAVAELDQGVADHAVLAPEPRVRDLAEPEGSNAASRRSFLARSTGLIATSPCFPARPEQFAQLRAGAVES